MAHKQAFFSFLCARWTTLFDARFDVLLYDLTSTYFESDPPFEDKRRFGYSRDKRSDCVQVVIALIVTPDGFPLAYEVMPGNTTDKTTLADFLAKIEQQYGRSERVWIMDRGIPTEQTLAAMREGDAPVRYLVGTPKGRLTRLEQAFLAQPWQAVRQSVDGQAPRRGGGALHPGPEPAAAAQGTRHAPAAAEEAVAAARRATAAIQYPGSAAAQARRRQERRRPQPGSWSISMCPQTDEEPGRPRRLHLPSCAATGCAKVRRREGRYLLRSNMTGEDPATLWRHYMQLTEIEQAFKELKHNLAIRPIFHQLEQRIEAHIFVSFIAYCLLVTLKNLARPQAPGLTPRAIVEKFAAIQMVDLHVPTADGRHLVLARHTQPSEDHELLLRQLDLALPKQPAPKLLS